MGFTQKAFNFFLNLSHYFFHKILKFLGEWSHLIWQRGAWISWLLLLSLQGHLNLHND